MAFDRVANPCPHLLGFIVDREKRYKVIVSEPILTE